MPKKEISLGQVRMNALMMIVDSANTLGVPVRFTVRDIVLWCLDKERKEGIHEGASNPYC